MGTPHVHQFISLDGVIALMTIRPGVLLDQIGNREGMGPRRQRRAASRRRRRPEASELRQRKGAVAIGTRRVHEFFSLDGRVDAPTWAVDHGWAEDMDERLADVIDCGRPDAHLT